MSTTRFAPFTTEERAVIGAALYLSLAMKVWAVGRAQRAGPGVVEHVQISRSLLSEVTRPA